MTVTPGPPRDVELRAGGCYCSPIKTLFTLPLRQPASQPPSHPARPPLPEFKRKESAVFPPCLT
ncbi:hypothetical protein E2C01_057475 [Portunus trituberculatus]|uniref:Uncharacterized protein n=1 Tax=Portunus trituberculatus TaxID=210409 RepID=A0A5B7H1Z9_PORTR|nr:hypothetical protein [Portunus trituberculatus]